MDLTVPPYSQARFQRIKDEVSDILKKIGYRIEAVPFVPISGWNKDNMVEESVNMPWYVGWSVEREEDGRRVKFKTLKDALNITKPAEQSVSKALRIPLQDVCTISDTGIVVPWGKIATGKLRASYSIRFAPSNIEAQVMSVESHYQKIVEAVPGDNIGFAVKFKDSNVTVDSLKRGYVCGTKGKDPPKEAKSFLAQVSLC